MYISFAGMVTFKKSDALRAVARTIPADRILIETDSPYLSPHPLRGKRNETAPRTAHGRMPGPRARTNARRVRRPDDRQRPAAVPLGVAESPSISCNAHSGTRESSVAPCRPMTSGC